jgi:hypothetical protein
MCHRLSNLSKDYLQTDDVDDTTSTGGAAVDPSLAGLPRHINITRPGVIASKVALPSLPTRLPIHSPGGVALATNSTRPRELEPPKVKPDKPDKATTSRGGAESEKKAVDSKATGGKWGVTDKPVGAGATDDEDMTAGSGNDEEYDDK